MRSKSKAINERGEPNQEQTTKPAFESDDRPAKPVCLSTMPIYFKSNCKFFRFPYVSGGLGIPKHHWTWS